MIKKSRSPSSWVGPLVTVIVLASFMATPLIVSDTYSLHFVWKVLFWAMLAAAWNIAGGYGGQFSLGHAAFFGIGAYASVLLYNNAGISPWIGMLVGGAAASLFALVIGLLTLRLRGAFFALASIAFAEVLRIAVVNSRNFTGGSEGLSISFSPSLANMMFSGRASYVVLMAGMLLLVAVITVAMERLPLGYSLAALREDEEAAEALGVDTVRVKLISITLSAFLSAMAGTLYAFYILLIEPSTVLSIGFSIEIALIAIIGGMGTVLGPVVGAILIVPLSEYLRAEFAGSFQGLYLLVYGALLIAMVMFLPNGLMSAVRDPRGALRRLRPGRPARPLSVEAHDA
jgi:branched-chain amino acid transport system permease protein